MILSRTKSLTFLLRHYELTNENVSYFLTNQSKTKTFIDLKVTRNPKPTKNSTRPYLNEIPAHFTHEIKTKGYDIIDKPVKLDILNEIPPQVNEIPQQFIHEIKTKGYDVSDVNSFPPP